MANVSYPRLHKAIRWACKLHKNQDRDGQGALPYITHVTEVVANLRYVGGVTDEDLLCAAALHDVIEQSDVSAAKIEDKFGLHVRDLVQSLTRKEPSRAQTKGMKPDAIWQMRSEMLLDEIKKMGDEAQLIKLADRLSNIRNARATKIGGKLGRTVGQTETILQIIPRRRNPQLWDAIEAEVTAAKTEITEEEPKKASTRGRKRKPGRPKKKRAAARRGRPSTRSSRGMRARAGAHTNEHAVVNVSDNHKIPAEAGAASGS